MRNFKKIPVALFLVGIVSILPVNAQTYVNKEWVEYHGAPDTIEWSASTTDVTGQQLITTGNTLVSGQHANILITKFSSDGDIAWQEDWDGPRSGSDYGAAIATDSNGNLYVAGASHYSSDSLFDIVVLKYDSSGTLDWVTSYDGDDKLNDYPVKIALDPNGNIFVTGASEGSMTNLDFITLKFSPSGTLQWDARYDYDGYVDVAADIDFIPDERVVITGGSEDTAGVWDYATVLYNDNGAEVAVERESSDEADIKKPKDLVKDGDNNLYITGVNHNGADNDIKLIKLDTALNTQWVEVFDETNEGSNALAIDDSNNLYVGGWIEEGNTRLSLVLKYDENGSLLWNNAWANAQMPISEVTDLSVDSEGTVSAIGFSTDGNNSDIVSIQYDKDGRLLWVETWTGLGNSMDYPTEIVENDNGDVYVSGRTEDSVGVKFVTIKYNLFRKTQTVLYDSLDNPLRFEQELVIWFQEDMVQNDIIDNKDTEHGTLEDFLRPDAIDSINTHLELNTNNWKCHKINFGLTSSDTFGISRSGDTVPIPSYYAILDVIVPTGIDDSLIAAQFNGGALDDIAKIAEFNIILRLNVNDPYYNQGYQGGLDSVPAYPDANINIEPAWDIETGKSNIRVGIFDNGLNQIHTDLDGTIAGGYDYVNNVPLSTNTSNDNIGHGTAIAGIIGAKRDNSFGIAGIAGGTSGVPGVTMYDMKNWDLDFSTPQSCDLTFPGFAVMAGAIIDGAMVTSVGGYAQHIQNHSWGTGQMSHILRSKMISAFKLGVALVAGSGNFSFWQPDPCIEKLWPGHFDEAMMFRVGANDELGGRADFTLCGDKLDFLAPGVLELYESPEATGNGFTDTLKYSGGSCVDPINGTSMAAPHVAGVVALMMGYTENTPGVPNRLSSEDCQTLMKKYCRDLDVSPYAPGWDEESGYGIIDAGRTMELIEYPDYQVKHYNVSVPASRYYDSVDFGHACNLLIGNKEFGGTSRLIQYSIEVTASHTIPDGYSVMDAWVRNERSTVAGNIIPPPSYVMSPCEFELGYSDYVMPSIKDFEINAYDASGITLTGYVYELVDSTYQHLSWWPLDPTTEIARFHYTLHLERDPVGMNGPSTVSNGFKVYPNPAADELHIEVTTVAPMQGRFRIAVYDLVGRLCVSEWIEGKDLSDGAVIDIGHLHSGAYVLKVTGDRFSGSEQIIVNKQSH